MPLLKKNTEGTVKKKRYSYSGTDCTRFLYFKSGWRRTWPDLGMKFRQNRSRIWRELVFGSHSNTADKSNGAVNAVNCYKKAAQFSASLVCHFFTKFVGHSGIGRFEGSGGVQASSSSAAV